MKEKYIRKFNEFVLVKIPADCVARKHNQYSSDLLLTSNLSKSAELAQAWTLIVSKWS